ncbi:diphthamide biosynthesis enzyme Dph2 [Candidatus Bathyarchaeota archaeon]|nr:diphthamide biosynthesis enzyme Dph2 [Candidatus Bathyarchaeota archaeon]MBS7630216.1 diphthamide biosynthesis enzyme Dph2 [Candidatus Bathyarchaeota archaeon]
MYDLEIERVSEEVRKRGSRRVLLQLPDGLRPRAFEIIKSLSERTDAEYFLHGGSCYGGCDLAFHQGEAVNADLIIHYGHDKMVLDEKIPLIYINARVNFEVDKLIDSASPFLKGWGRIGLATTIQHSHQLEEAANCLKKKGYSVVVGGEGKKAHEKGQVLGCDYSSSIDVAAKVDGFLFIGGGRFHPLGLAYATRKPVVAADPYTLTVYTIGESELNRFAMRRMAAIEAARKASLFGVIVSIKPGQLKMKIAEQLRETLKSAGKEAVTICLDEVQVENLMNFSEFEAFVNTACPRIVLDGDIPLPKPIINWDEALIMLGLKGWWEGWKESLQG